MLLPGYSGCDQSQPQQQSFSSSSSLLPFAPFAPLASAASPATGETARTTAPQPALLASPPASPLQMTGPQGFSDLITSCRNLQALLSAPTPAAPLTTMAPLLPITPPQQHQELLSALTGSCPTSPTPVRRQRPSAEAPMRLRLRPRRAAPTGEAGSPASGAAVVRKRIVRRSTNTAAPPPQPTRGPNKRRREASDEDDDISDDADEAKEDHEEADVPAHPFFLAPSPMRRVLSSPRRSTDNVSASFSAGPTAPLPPPPTSATTEDVSPSTPPRPQTPKRARIAPAALPLGLARSDYHALHADGVPDDSSSRIPDVADDDDDVWTTEDDRMLVELVLEKLKLSKTEWQECARTLGRRDRHSLGRRWKSLMLHGEIGLRPAVGSAQGARGSRRSRLHGTWR